MAKSGDAPSDVRGSVPLGWLLTILTGLVASGGGVWVNAVQATGAQNREAVATLETRASVAETQTTALRADVGRVEALVTGQGATLAQIQRDLAALASQRRSR